MSVLIIVLQAIALTLLAVGFFHLAETGKALRQAERKNRESEELLADARQKIHEAQKLNAHTRQLRHETRLFLGLNE